MSWAQLRALGVAKSTISRWIATGYLIPMLPRVYAVGHAARDEPARLYAAVLSAGPGAALSHVTAAHWRGWLRYPSQSVQISTPRRIRTKPAGIKVHGRRGIERELVRGIPCTKAVQTLLDLAATERQSVVLHALAQLDYERRLDPDALRAACGRGRPGSAGLLRALSRYVPQLARTKSELEDAFLLLCLRAGIPMPEVNATLGGIEVDCIWRALGLVVELDGVGNHGSVSQRGRDHDRALTLRGLGLDTIRYTWAQVTHRRAAVIGDLRRQIERHAQVGDGRR